MLNTKWFNSKIIVIILAICLVLTSFSFVFADDSAPDPVQVPAAELSEEEQEFINNASDEKDLIIRQAVVTAVRSSSGITLENLYDLLFACITNIHGRYEWCVTDQVLYQLLNNNFSHYDSSSGNTYDTGAMLWFVLQNMNQLNAEIVPALSSAPTLYQVQSSILTALNNLNAELIPASQSADTLYEIASDLDNTLNSFWLAFQAHAAAQVDYTSALWYNNIGVAEYAYKTWQTSANIFTFLNNTFRPLISNIDNNITSISNNVSQFKDDFNNIVWTNVNNAYLGYTLNSINTPIQNTENIQLRSGDVLYLYFNNTNITGTSILKFYLSIYSNQDTANNNLFSNIVAYDTNGNSLQGDFHIEYDYNQFSSICYLYNLAYPRTSGIILKLSIQRNCRISKFALNPCTLSYITSNQNDFYTVYSYLIEQQTLKHYDLWKELYASDDIIEAKEAQKPLEDSVLEDFTGSGSASASVADAVNIKGVQSSIKGSLNTGSVSASGLATVLNTSNPSSSSSFFSFWTSSVADDINGVQNIEQTRNLMYTHIDDSREFDELVRGQSW